MFNRRDLARVVSASTGSQANWLYSTQDTQDTVLDSSYFGEVSPQLRVNDVIQCRLIDRYINLAVISIDTKINIVVTQKIDFLTPLEQQGLVNWRGTWEQDEYEKNDQVYDNGWLMIANKTTTTRPSPQQDGDPSYGLPTTPAWVTQDNQSVVYSGHRYLFSQGGWVNQIRVWVPELTDDTTYRFILLIDEPGKVTESITIEEPVLNLNAWTLLKVGTRLVRAGTTVLFVVDALNSGGSTGVTGGWTRNINDNANPPALNGWNHSVQNNILRIDAIDLDQVGRLTELLTITVNSTIQFVDTLDADKSISYRIQAEPVDRITYVEYSVTVISVGPSGEPDIGVASIMNADVPVPQPTKFVELIGNWPIGNATWATAEGYLAYDDINNSQPGVETNAYGVDLLFQPAIVNDDWDFEALTGDGGPANTNAQYGDSVSINSATQLTAISNLKQEPTGLGFANKIQVNFGFNQLPLLDSNGTYTAQTPGQRSFSIRLNFERFSNGGEAWIWFYTTTNGVPSDNSAVIKIDSSSSRQRESFIFSLVEDLNVGDEVKFYIFRDPSKMDDGYLIGMTSPEPTINDSPSAFLEVTNLVIA